MAINKWLVLSASGEFKTGGFFEPVSPVLGDGSRDPAYAIVVLPSEAMPDIVRERYDATSQTLRRLATQTELDAATQATRNATAQIDSVDTAIKATVAWTLFKLLGRLPTGAELQTAQSQWITAYKQFN
jgi:hypothetical protein